MKHIARRLNAFNAQGEPSHIAAAAGLLTATPCSAVPGLQVLDNVTEEWVDAERAATCGVTSRGP